MKTNAAPSIVQPTPGHGSKEQSSRRPKVLIVDDHQANVELIKVQLKSFNYELDWAFDGEEALDKIRAWKPDLVLLDLMMPKLDGYAVCKAVKSDKELRFIPVIIVTALRELDDKLKAIEIGADDFLIKPFNKLELATRIKSLLRMKELYDDLDSSESILFSLAEALEAKDVYTRGHSERVSRYSLKLGHYIGLDEKELNNLRKGSLLHDIGKIGIQEQVLHKPGPLNEEEFNHIRTHPERGWEICRPLKSLSPCLSVIRHHHERFDGCGHPDCLRGEGIALIARIAAIADTFDAMTSNRPYRKGITPLEAVTILDREKTSGQWDPELLKAFIKMFRNNGR